MSTECSQGQVLAWILRLVGFGLALAGLVLMLHPLAVLVSVLPIPETVVVAVTVVMPALAALLTLRTIAVASIVLRPLLSPGLLAAGLVIVAVCIGLRQPEAPQPRPATPIDARFTGFGRLSAGNLQS
jgi:Transmembrane protein 43